jgi:hypothetical protein
LNQSIAIVAEAANARIIAFGANGDPTLTRNDLSGVSGALALPDQSAYMQPVDKA